MGTVYLQGPLSKSPTKDVSALATQLRDGKLVIYSGAGLSMAAPSHGPSGPALAAALQSIVAEAIGMLPGGPAAESLEGLTQRVATVNPEALPAIKERAAEAFRFVDMVPNYGHRAIALLMREGYLSSITANWDCAIETAGHDLNVKISGVTAADRQLQMREKFPLHKLHGCASRPATLAITQDEVNSPHRWSETKTLAALDEKTVVFVGLGTLGEYVSTPIGASAKASRADISVHIVNREISQGWRDALGDASDACFTQMDADEFLDAIMSLLVVGEVGAAAFKAAQLANRETWATDMVKGAESFKSQFEHMNAVGLIRWWTDGVVPSKMGDRFISTPPGCQSLMSVFRLIGLDGGRIVVSGTGTSMTVSSDSQYYEVVYEPNAHWRDVESRALDYVRRRDEANLYPDGRPANVVVADCLGTVPSRVAEIDIMGEATDPHDIADASPRQVRLISVSEAISRGDF